MAKRPQPQQPARPQGKGQPQSKEDALAEMIGKDPKKAAEILREILKNK